ncbi:MAG TPA: hypothetical protein VIJ90_06715 [Gemmatimonadaceae bacterium]
MNRRRGTGLALIIVGSIFLASASRRAVPSTIGVIAGVLLILAGLLRTFRSPSV